MAESSKEGYGSKRVVLPMVMIMVESGIPAYCCKTTTNSPAS
jgi:hypothetical protein